MVHIGNDWDEVLKDEFAKEYYKELRTFLKEEYENHVIYPPADSIFKAFELTSYSDTKVVILGQDPYHEPGQAQGLAFSVPCDVKFPPSLRNILKELADDRGLAGPYVGRRPEPMASAGEGEGVLVPWAKQGVLLLNTALTVREHEAASHKGRGWEVFTDEVIRLLARREKPLVFILWGAPAGKKKDLILEAEAGNSRHLIITAPHPSPLSAHRGFFGGRYFSRCNYFLCDNGMAPINWELSVE